jgi:hypothetical protein
LNFHYRFSKNPQIQNFIKICPVGANFCGQTDITKLTFTSGILPMHLQKTGKMNKFVINPWGLASVLYEWMAVSHDDVKQHEEWTLSADNVPTRKVKNKETKLAETSCKQKPIISQPSFSNC